MTMNKIAAPLAAALADRGYENLTAVQTAMMNEDSAGRDLLVSAQTGSGKTVAFGIAAAADILDAAGQMPESSAPLALLIAPTRELALQVAAEFRWLYAATGAKIATCVGGMDYRTERRALERGAQIVVGTPGRLRDHIERASLDTSALKVAVLDEADEMLDLGFREDLEFILEAAPEDRRTLLFSATVPPAIEKLARDFQNDALRIAAKGEARQHGDISYRALSVASRDRENAIFNLLRFYEARTAIVFCRTRANVNHLLARMGNRGFRVVALSGELSQQERTHALQALRDGRAKICIATDVAARGIDLPGLDLVIHADLPLNSEILLHRSGRTGRAGSKGVSALVVPPADYRRAQRLLQQAKVVAEWGKPPSADDVRARDDERMTEHPALQEPLDDMAVANQLLERFGPEQVAAGFVRLWREGRPVPEELADITPPAEGASRAPREFGDSVWFSLSVGREGRAEPRWLLPKICEAGGVNRSVIGAIRIRDQESYVQIASDQAGRFAATTELEPGLVMTRLQGEPDLERRTERAPRPRPAYRDGPRDGFRDGDAPRKPRYGNEGKPAAYGQRPAKGYDPTAGEIPFEAPSQKKPRWNDDKKSAKPKKPSAPAGHKPKGKFSAPTRRARGGDALPRRPR